MDDVIGFKLIGEMSREELIEELVSYQRKILLAQDDACLRAYIVNNRLERTKERLMREAGLKEQRTGIFSSYVEDDHSED